MTATIHHGDCINVMRGMPADSIDAIITDPPYGLGFMGKAWDALPPGEEWARECLRVIKPGGHLLSFGGTRTWHRLAVAVEDAGFEIRDSIAWLYGSGFPKSLDVSKAIDKAAGAERTEVIGSKLGRPGMAKDGSNQRNGFDSAFGGEATGVMSTDITAPATDAARQWQGWGTALKPAFEPIVVARKPIIGTVAANVQTHGVGALNIDATRIRIDPADLKEMQGRSGARTGGNLFTGRGDGASWEPTSAGRWPANVALDEHQAAALDEQSGVGASRFMYCAKAPKSERPVVDGVAHPTVKPLALMRWLVRLVTPPGGTILDPFAGSGTTIEAALQEGFNVTGIEQDPDYLPLIQARINRTTTTVSGDPAPFEDAA